MTDLTPCVEGWVEGLLSPINVALGEFSTIVDVSAQLQPAPTQAVVRSYLSGGGVYQYGYELYLRVRPTDERGRVDAIAELNKVADAIDHKSWPEAPSGVTWYGHEVTARPNKFSTNEDGSEDYQLIAVVTYIERSQ
jgi:hypothetical protein